MCSRQLALTLLALSACGGTTGTSARDDAASDASVSDTGMLDAHPRDASKPVDAAHDRAAEGSVPHDAGIDAVMDAVTVLDARPESDVTQVPDARDSGPTDAGVDAPVVSPWSADLPSGAFSAVAVDSHDNTLAGGTTTSSSVGSPYFAQYTSTGAPAWQKQLSAAGATYGVATDALDNVLFVGNADAAIDFGGGALQEGGYIVEYDTTGSYLFAKTFAGAVPFAVARAQSGWVIVGWYNGTVDFGGGPLPPTSDDGAFVLELDSSGAYVFAVTFTGLGNSQAFSIAIDRSGDLVLAGSFDGSLDLGGGAMVGPMSGSGQTASFVAMLDPTGHYLHQATFHVAGSDSVAGVSVDSSGSVYVGGTFDTTINLGGGSVDSQGQRDIFLGKLDSSFAYVWGKSFGDSNDQLTAATAVDPAGNVVIVGSMRGTVDFGGGPLSAPQDDDQAFLARFDPSGNPLSTGIVPATTSSIGYAVAAPTSGPSDVIVGQFTGTLNLGQGPFTSSGSGDGFVAWWVP